MPDPIIKKPSDYFNVLTYTGTGATQTISGLGFQPDWVWIKGRSGATDHKLTDAVRGATKSLESNTTDAEATDSNGITAFTSTGFTVGSDSVYNNNGSTYVAWCWNANSGSTVSNTAGSITSTVSANTTAGFSIVTYTGTGGTGTTTVGHGLGVAPSMVIVKRRNGTTDWASYHTGLTSTSYYLVLNSTAAQANYGSTFISPSSSTLTIAADSSLLNTSTGTYVAYCFAPVAGYSAFGSYTGNGSSDGTFVFTGFRPKFVLMKATTGSNNWIIYDTVRNTYNLTNLSLVPDSSAVENGVSTTTENTLDILSNGFKLRTSNALTNGSSVPYIYMAFAESPFKYANAR